VVIPGLGGPGGTAGGHGRAGGPPAGRGGVPVGGGPTGSRNGAPAGGRGGSPAGSSSAAPTPGKGKQTHVVLDDDEVSSDEDDLCRSGCGNFPALGRWCSRLWQLSGVEPVVLDEAAAADKEVADKRAAVKRAAEEWAAAKAAAAEEVAGKTVDEAAGAVGGSPAPRPGALSARGQEGCGSTPPAKRPYRGVWKPRFVQLSLLSFFFFSSGASFSYYTFCPGPLPLARPP
jgi:hypothetical protein